jgi:pilus assembly protein Flp/PilA
VNGTVSRNRDGDETLKGGEEMLWTIYFGVESLKARFTREDGAVATEYGLLLVLIALAIIVAATALGVAISGVFSRASGSLGGAGS